MATSEQAERLRRDVGFSRDNETALPQTEIDELFIEAGESYTDVPTTSAYVRVLYLQGLLASASKRASYRQNSTTENLSDVFKHLRDLYDLWWDRFQESVHEADVDGVVRSGRQTQVPTRLKEYPNS